MRPDSDVVMYSSVTVHAQVRNRSELIQSCYKASELHAKLQSQQDKKNYKLSKAAYAEKHRQAVEDCVVTFRMGHFPESRIIVQSMRDFETLGVTAEELYQAASQEFWAYGDFHNVVETFQMEPEDRRVLGIRELSPIPRRR